MAKPVVAGREGEKDQIRWAVARDKKGADVFDCAMCCAQLGKQAQRSRGRLDLARGLAKHVLTIRKNLGERWRREQRKLTAAVAVRPRSRTGKRALEYTQCTEGGGDGDGEGKESKKEEEDRWRNKTRGKLFRSRREMREEGRMITGHRLSINDSMACSTEYLGSKYLQRASALGGWSWAYCRAVME